MGHEREESNVGQFSLMDPNICLDYQLVLVTTNHRTALSHVNCIDQSEDRTDNDDSIFQTSPD